MTTHRSFLKTLTTPKQFTANDGIAFWQEKVLLTLLFIAVGLGFVTLIPSVILSVKEKLWVIAFMDTAMYAFVLFLFFRRGLSYTVRAGSIVIISYFLGIVLIATLGPFGAGPVWLFFFPVITGILLGQRMAVAALTVNALTLVGLGGLIHYNVTDLLVAFNFNTWYMAPENPLEKWGVISLNFMLLNIAAALMVTTILNGLQYSIKTLALSEKKHRRIFENILDVYLEIAPDGTILEVSPSIRKVSGYSNEDLKGRSLSFVWDSESPLESTLAELFRTGGMNNREIALHDRDGNRRICSVNAQVTGDGSGEKERAISIFRDISQQKAIEEEKKRLREQLNRSQKMEALGLMAGGVAHDLNNILSGVVSYPEVLALDLEENDPMKKSLEIIQSSGKKAAEIVQDLLTLSRRGVVNRETLNLNDLVSAFFASPECEKIFSYHPGVSVTKQLEASLPCLKGSRVHLQKSLMNLVSNAAEAQPAGGDIHISTRNIHLDTPLKGYDRVETGDYVVLSVRDRGTGIDPDDLRRIFEPFFTKKVMGRSGTGLGMAVVWGTVQDHSGYIDVISEKDIGTTFDLYFPISREEMMPPKKAGTIDQYMGMGEKILIVDDVAEQREIAGAILRKLGYEFASVPGGEAAIEYLKENRADLLLLDMIMPPGIDGLDTYKKILEVQPGQKAVIASGYSHSRQVNDALQLGAGSYIKKPYTIEKIGRAIKDELSK